MPQPTTKICRECKASHHKTFRNVKNAVLENESNVPENLSRSSRGILNDYVHKNIVKKPEDFAQLSRMAIPITKFWKNTTVLTVSFMGGDKSVKDRIRQHAIQWMEFANIELKFVTNSKKPTIVRIAFDTKDGSWSYVGTDNKTIEPGDPTMNYGWLFPETPDEEYHRTVMHEFGHALGCIHEHQHPAGGIPWDKKAAYAYYQKQGWTKEEVDQQVFNKYKGDLIRASKVDKKSIMMYPIPDSITIGNYEVGWNNELSPGDKKYIRAVYKK
jgi:serralysin